MGYKMRINDYLGSIRVGEMPVSVPAEAPPGQSAAGRPAVGSEETGPAEAVPKPAAGAAETP
jgi:hypothetical protein